MWNVRKSLTSVQKTAGDYQRRNALSRATATFQLVERTARQLPIDRSYERGRVGIFNRSYYDEVLIVRVHPEILQHEQLPESVVDSDTIWAERYESIVDSERHLFRNGTRIIEFFLHLSKERTVDSVRDNSGRVIPAKAGIHFPSFPPQRRPMRRPETTSSAMPGRIVARHRSWEIAILSIYPY